MSKTSRDYEELLAAFARHDVKAVIVGAHAVAFHAKPRYTKDLDLLVEPSADNAARLLTALEEFGFGSIGLTLDDFATPGRIVQLGVAPTRIDLSTSIDGVTFEEVWRSAEHGQLGSQPALFIGLDELIHNKRTAARPQDLADLSWLEAVKKR
jgi:hypothetical protein